MNKNNVLNLKSSLWYIPFISDLYFIWSFLFLHGWVLSLWDRHLSNSTGHLDNGCGHLIIFLLTVLGILYIHEGSEALDVAILMTGVDYEFDFFLWCHVGQSFIPDGELSSMNCFFCYAPRSFLPVTSNVFFRYEAADTSAWGSPFTADMIAASLCVHGVVDLPNHRCSLHSWSWSTKIKLQQYSAASSSCKIA